MKARKIAMLAALPAAILVANSAFAGVDVYGKVNLTLQQQQEEVNNVDTVDAWYLNSNASRFGIKASTDLGDSGLKAVAKMEYQVAVDDGESSTTTATTCTDGANGGVVNGTIEAGECSNVSIKNEFSQRNIYGGFQGSFGTVIAGKFDTPVKEAQGKVDLFNDLVYGDIGNVIQGEDRVSNIIMYSTPKMDSGVAVNFAVMPGEGSDLDGDGKVDDGVADAYSASLTWENDMFYTALAVNQAVDSRDLIRLVGQAKMGDFTLGAIVQQAELSDDLNNTVKSDEDGYVLSAAYSIGKTTLKAQYADSSDDNDIGAGDARDKSSTSVGVDYKLDKKAKVFAYWTDWTQEEGTAETNKDTFALGMEYNF